MNTVTIGGNDYRVTKLSATSIKVRAQGSVREIFNAVIKIYPTAKLSKATKLALCYNVIFSI